MLSYYYSNKYLHMLEKLKQLFTFNHEKYDCIFDDPKSKFGLISDKIIITLILFFPLILIFESIWNNAIDYVNQIYILDAIISIVFAFEYFIRLFEAKDKIAFLYNPLRIIDLLSFLPFFIWFVIIWNYLKILRIVRVLRILKLFREIPLTSWFIKALKDYSDEYRAVFTLYFIILFLFSFFVYFIEKWVAWTYFHTLPDALRWGIVTTTTVWYWDIELLTPLWKMIWSILVFVWPLLWWLISAVTIMVFMETSRNQEAQKLNRRWKVCPRCHTKNTKSANYCIQCWKKFKLLKDMEVVNKIY